MVTRQQEQKKQSSEMYTTSQSGAVKKTIPGHAALQLKVICSVAVISVT